MAEYFGFLRGGPPPGEGADVKAVAGRHAAGKGILAHLEQLFRTAGGMADGEADAAEIAGGQLAAARAAMASLPGEEAGENDGDDG